MNENNRLSIIVYNDCKVFGGHEMMTLKLVNNLCELFDVNFVYYNTRFKNELSPNVKSIVIPIRSRFSYGGLGSFYLPDIIQLVKVFKNVNPKLIIISQGVIELGLKALWASKYLNIKAISYIPQCESFHNMKAPFGAIRDILNDGYFKLFDGIITISREQKRLIEAKHYDSSKIFILHNYIEFRKFNFSLNKSTREIRIGIIGRISFKDKAQFRAIKIAKISVQDRFPLKFIIVGDGPDRVNLQKLIVHNDLESTFSILGWQENIEKIYSNLDLVLITSIFEGVPLVLLEAIILDKIVLAPNFGVFKEYLPDIFLYETEEEAFEKIKNLSRNLHEFSKKLVPIKELIMTIHSKSNFQSQLINIIKDWIN